MPHVRIFQRPKNAMQSGRARTDQWLLEFVPREAKRPDPLTGWAGSGDTREQIKLKFASEAEAVAYAVKKGWDYTLIPAPERKLKLQAYSDNFK